MSLKLINTTAEIDPDEYRKKWPKLNWMPISLKFTFRTPVMLGAPYVSFDGILSHFLLRLVLEQNYYTLPSKTPSGEIARLIYGKHAPTPAKVTGFDLDGHQAGDYANFMMCSVMDFRDIDDNRSNLIEASKIATIYKKFEDERLDQLKTRKTKIPIASGTYKNYAMKIPYIPVHHAYVHLIGKIELLDHILQHIQFIGKKVAYGYGEVSRIEYLSNDNHKSAWDPETREALRPIPVNLCSSYEDAAMLPWRAPYWDKRNVELCVPPFVKCEPLEIVKDKLFNGW